MTQTIALVTGANKGLGRETVRRLAGRGWQVFLAARDTGRGAAAAAELAAAGADVRFVALDVTSDDSVMAAADTVKSEAGRLDVLINNAGIGGPRTAPSETRPEDLREVFETNVFGPIRVTNAFLPLLRLSGHPRIVMVSSGIGSIATITDPKWAGLLPPALGYPSTKAALNMLTVMYASELDTMKVNAVDPGYTATDLNGHSGFQTVTEGTDAIVAMATIGPDGPTGAFVDRTGTAPW
ncbi:SDR family oxidoreductase [Nocardia ignorata]|uniref:NAD(P)-dependent dehydrogenase (Short-subunit alcohol dehydrogenase family) n=1 Tax=Nocardia ignorata TaxID=145285 RepID=A0A4R6PTS9_NOCIG|nr:SDR family oxidoreductase [Nocardia ignorata]TDP42291.1 NAD(P)-dependent dehydrogenase (short-subunit alcohol dehydrogenase family) [Nocardia ignorata]